MATKAVNLFRELARNPGLKSARFVEVNESVIAVDSIWLQRCIEQNRWQNVLRTYIISKSELKCISISKPHLPDECVWEVPSPSGNKVAIVRKHIPKDGKPSDEKWFFEIWSTKGNCENVFDVTSCEKHGAVYGSDGAFGSLSWNSQEDKLAYVAEKKQPKGVSYFADPKKVSDDKENPVPGTKFLYKEDWGEELVDKIQPVICMLDITSGDVTVLDEELLNNSSCGQVVWCPNKNGVVFCAFAHGTVKLGITYCPIRQSTLYYYNLTEQILKSLSDSGSISIRSPRFSPDGSKLVYLQCESGGPHHKCSQLKMIEWRTGDTKVVVDVVYQPGSDADFYGIYGPSLPENCWHSNSAYVFLATPCRTRKDIFAIDVATSKIKRVTDVPGSWLMEDISSGYILASVSTANSTPRLAIGRLKDFDECGDVHWNYLEAENVISNMSWEVLEHTPKIPHPDYGSLVYESIILRPTEGESKGLIVLPHGGPHSGYTSRYALYYTFFAKLGFTLALVNYRGSTGYGEDCIRSLLGNIGDNDVKDVQQCAEEVLQKYSLDREKVVVLGASHGGFIASHLIGQYPEFYTAAAVDCGVTNLVSKVSLTDIPDWGHVEVGWDSYVPCEVPSAEAYSLLYSKSPVAHIHKVKAPTMVLVGNMDRRVPPSQGIEYYKALRARNIPTKLFLFPDANHALSIVEVESDSLVNIYIWFATHLGLT